MSVAARSAMLTSFRRTLVGLKSADARDGLGEERGFRRTLVGLK